MRSLAELQAYVDDNRELHEAVGADVGERLELRPFARGEYNANYAFEAGGRPLLLRVNLGSQMHLADQIGYEAQALRLLEPSGRTPLVWYVDSTCGCLVEDLLPGRALRYESDLPEAARILADIHAVPEPATSCLLAPRDPLGAILEECAAMLAVYRSWDGANKETEEAIEELARQVRRRVAHARRSVLQERHIVNTELNSGNFLIGENGAPSYLIDWEKPLLGEVAQDLGHLLAPTTTFWKTDVVLERVQVTEFIEHYENAVAGRFDTAGLARRVEAYLAATCLRGVTWCAMAYSQYADDGRDAEFPEVFAKIGSYMDPAFLVYIRDEWCCE